MSADLSKSVVPAAQQMLDTLDHLLVKAADRCAATNVEESVYLEWRIAPDMFPFATQIRFATEIPARALSRLAGGEVPGFDDDEATIAELQGRIERVRSIIAGLDMAALDAEPEAEITVPMGQNQVRFPRAAFAREWMLPNLYFHVTTAYLILRRLGVDIGKRDYLVSLARKLGA